MEKIFEGEVCELLPLSNGLIFSYCRERVDESQADISYKMISFEEVMEQLNEEYDQITTIDRLKDFIK